MKKLKILIVDDNVSFLEMLADFLTDEGYEVLTTSNGRVAQDKFSEFNPDVVLTDIVMPEVDGIELLIGLRKINSDIVVMAMSGGNKGHADSYLRMAEKLGANIILYKPFKLSELLEQIKKLEVAA